MMMNRLNKLKQWYYRRKNHRSISLLIIAFCILLLILISNLIFFASPRFDEARKIRDEGAEKPLKNFNENVFKNIAFRGIILKNEYDRYRVKENGKGFGVEVYWLTVKINGKIYNPKNVPLQIARIYDLTNMQKSKIYFTMNTNVCIIDDDNNGDSIIKNYGEDFYRIKFKGQKPEYHCDRLYYTVDFDYFWKEKDLNKILDTIPKTSIWEKIWGWH